MRTAVFAMRTMVILMSVFCLALSVSSEAVFAAEPEFKVVTTDKLKEMLDGKANFTLIDARTREEYDEAHIESAVHITEKEYDKQSAALPSDRNALLIFYCNGVKCGKSKKVAAKAAAQGYVNILVYDEGFPAWDEQGLPVVASPDYREKVAPPKISAGELAQLLRERKEVYLLVDVREESEYAQGHIPGAVNLPAAALVAKKVTLPQDKEIIVYCNSGGGSFMAYRMMLKLASTRIHQTVFAEWKEAGFPIEKSAQGTK